MTSKQSCILGLDISTSCTGVAALTPTGDVIMVSYFKPKGETLVQKANSLKHFIIDFYSDIGSPNIDSIFIEQNLQRFRRGFSSAAVINTLARFNGMISYISFENFNVQPEYVDASAGRRSLGIKIPRGKNTKELIFDWCKQEFPDIEWPMKKLKSL